MAAWRMRVDGLDSAWASPMRLVDGWPCGSKTPTRSTAIRRRSRSIRRDLDDASCSPYRLRTARLAAGQAASRADGDRTA